MFTNENDFLGMLIKNANENHEVHHSKAMKLSGLDDAFYFEIYKSLKQKRVHSHRQRIYYADFFGYATL